MFIFIYYFTSICKDKKQMKIIGRDFFLFKILSRGIPIQTTFSHLVQNLKLRQIFLNYIICHRYRNCPFFFPRKCLFTFPKVVEFFKKIIRGFPGGAVVENLPANAGDTGSSPGLGRSHMPQSSQARESQLLSLHVWSLCSATREAAIVRGPRTAMKSGPRLPQLEKALAQKRRPNTAINK